MSEPVCPKCASQLAYHDGVQWVCPECAHEWSEQESNIDSNAMVIKDAHGQVLQDGDQVTVIKDLKIKGSSSVVKVGTKVKNIRLLPEASDGHDIDCKVDGIGAIKLKSIFVKKA